MFRMLTAVLLAVVSMAAPATSRAASEESCSTGFMMWVDNGDFETRTYRSWCTEGPMSAGTETGTGRARSGQGNAYLQTATPQWNGMAQSLNVMPPKQGCIELTAWVRAMGRVDNGRIGVRLGSTATVVSERTFSAAGDAYRQINLKFNGAMSAVTIYIGYHSAAEWSRLLVDDIQLGSSPSCA